nr:unnamed protein product [Haemonchus contortus]
MDTSKSQHMLAKGRQNSDSSVCVHCVAEQKRVRDGGPAPRIKVIGNVFLTDPCSIHHVCTPGKHTEERGNRQCGAGHKEGFVTRREGTRSGLS